MDDARAGKPEYEDAYAESLVDAGALRLDLLLADGLRGALAAADDALERRLRRAAGPDALAEMSVLKTLEWFMMTADTTKLSKNLRANVPKLCHSVLELTNRKHKLTSVYKK